MSFLWTTKRIGAGLGVAAAVALLGCSRTVTVKSVPSPVAKPAAAMADANGGPDRAIDFTLVDTHGKRVQLSTFRGGAPLILEFFGPD